MNKKYEMAVNLQQDFTAAEQTQGRNNIGAASASDVAALQSQVSSLSDVSAYTVKGEATVAQLNAGPSGIQAGWAYQLTNSGTLTDGTLAVVAGDTVAWDGTKWFPLVKSDYYATKTYAQNVAHSIAPEFDPTRTSENPYKHNESVIYNGKLYRVQKEHYGVWNSADFYEMPLVDYFNQIIFDGSIADTGNVEKVRTIGLPFANRTKFVFYTDRPLDEGHYYQFGYILSDDEAAVARSLYVGHPTYNIVGYVTARNASNIRLGDAVDFSEYPTAKVIAIEVTEKDENGNGVILRKEDFAGFKIGLVEAYDASAVYNYVDTSVKNSKAFLSETEIVRFCDVGQILQGTISSDGVYTPEVTNRICSGIFVIGDKLGAKFTDGYQVLVRYYSSNGSLSDSTDWLSTNDLVVFKRNLPYARFVFAKTNDANISPSDAVGVLDTCSCYVTRESLVDGDDLVDISTLSRPFVQGGVSSYTGAASPTSNSDSAYFDGYFFAGCFDRLRFKLNKDGYVLALYYYDFDNVYKGRSEYAKDEIVVDVDADKCRIKVVIMKVVKANADIPSNIYSALKIYSTKASLKSQRCKDLQNRIFGMNGIYFPKISGHRGSIIDAPENSIPSFTLAGKRGYWACESDIGKTSDGKYVMMHDETVNRTTNGSGRLDSLTFAEVEALTLTNGIGHNAESYTPEELKVPTLDQYLSICREYGMIAFIELKVFDMPSFLEIYEIIKSWGMQERCVISAADAGILKNVRFITDLPVWAIFPSSVSYPLYYAMAGSGAGINMTYADLDNHPEVKAELQKMVSKQMKCAIRAVDTIEDAVTALELGISCFNTNALKPSDFEVLRVD